MQEVLVASRDINISEALNEENVRIASLPKSVIQQGALKNLEDLENRFARVRLYPGEPILRDKVMGTEGTASSIKVPPGYRVVSVKVTSESSVSSLVTPGDRVDIVVVLRDSPDMPMAFSKTILRAVRVFAVNSEIARTADLGTNVEEARTVSVLLKPDQVETLMMAADLGRIRLSLRSPDDPEVEETTGCTIEKIFGRGDVAEETSGSGAIDIPGLRGLASHPRQPVQPAVEDHWRMVISSPDGDSNYRWQEEGGRPDRCDLAAANDNTPIPAPAEQPQPPTREELARMVDELSKQIGSDSSEN
jgi:pilus assembly protein CpaB